MITPDESAAEKGFQDEKAADNPLPERRKMSEIEDAPRSYSGAILVVIALALLCALGGLIWSYMLSGRLTHNEAALAEAAGRDRVGGGEGRQGDEAREGAACPS